MNYIVVRGKRNPNEENVMLANLKQLLDILLRKLNKLQQIILIIRCKEKVLMIRMVSENDAERLVEIYSYYVKTTYDNVVELLLKVDE